MKRRRRERKEWDVEIQIERDKRGGEIYRGKKRQTDSQRGRWSKVEKDRQIILCDEERYGETGRQEA